MTCKSKLIRNALLWGVSICLFAPVASFASAADQNLSQTELAKHDFIESVFTGETPTEQTLWLKQDIKKDVARIMGHKKFPGLRVRYQIDGTHTAWVLEEIGKYKPITVGISVRDGAIDNVSVLAYRESHGWEVKHDFFTRQFIGASLKKNWKLDEKVDGISGATLSVRALKKLARLALYFDQTVQGTAKASAQKTVKR